jgi:DNA repair exonuclease SbcCD ATPase subunit
MNRWDALPNDLRDYILQIQGLLLIQKNARKKLLKMTQAKKFASNILDMIGDTDDFRIMDVMDPVIASKLEYCVKHSDKSSIKFWTDFHTAVDKGLYFDQYTGGPGSVYYNRSYEAAKNIAYKYNILSSLFM